MAENRIYQLFTVEWTRWEILTKLKLSFNQKDPNCYCVLVAFIRWLFIIFLSLHDRTNYRM